MDDAKMPSQSQDDGTQPSAQGGQKGDQSGAGASQTITEEEYGKLKNELEETGKKLEEMTKITQHALADLQNFRRRSEEERKNWVMYANLELLSELLPAIDNMNRAAKYEPKDAEWIKGVDQVVRQLFQILEKKGLKTIPAAGQKFDPKLHEALLTAPGEKDLILEELEKGYMLGDKVIKHARVKVGNGGK